MKKIMIRMKRELLRADADFMSGEIAVALEIPRTLRREESES